MRQRPLCCTEAQRPRQAKTSLSACMAPAHPPILTPTAQHRGTQPMKEFAFLIAGIVIGSVVTRKSMERKELARELDRERTRQAR